MNRRELAQGLAASWLLCPLKGEAQPWSENYRRWSASYLRDGRIIDWHQNGVSHSEGQGYGLLLSQAAGDRMSFEKIEGWTQAHLATRHDHLMGWKWEPAAGPADWRNATDGDLFRAWALLRAERDSGWAGYRQQAIQIARDVARLCLAADPRAADEWLLLPGAEARHGKDRVLVNPSYLMSRALRELGQEADEPRLVQAADHGETLLVELATAGFMPNWVDVSATGFLAPQEHEMAWGYDALRVPLYLAWSDRRDHPAVQLALHLLQDAATPGHVVVAASPTGQIRAQSNMPGFLAVAAAAECRPLTSFTTGRDYYSDTLLLLAEVALKEGGCHP